MKKIASYILFLLLICSAAASADVKEDFTQRRSSLNREQYYKVFNQNLSPEERECMEFLYAYMPMPDMVDYSGDFWLKNVDLALKARKEMTWGTAIPEREWRHFVLPVRVNNENMDMSREAFYEELKGRVIGLTMTEAALEVNHWCHEKVTYQPSDARTSSPLASVRSAIGRCGEESTFCVAAMRSIGIPARQVYTPRWAHTDDNHAWVEVWVDGGWHFLGACEPEAVLDLGWFNAPASRGMLMHTKVFGNYDGPEEVMSRNNCFTEIDVTANYAPVAEAKVLVTDADDNPVGGAKVEYKLYNYAEFYTVATKTTDAEGVSILSAGKGDLLIWASKDGMFGMAKCTVGNDGVVKVKIDKPNNFVGRFDIDIVPPVERNTIPYQTPQQIKENKVRLAHEDSIRQAYVNTFITNQGEYMLKARGNHSVIGQFISSHPGEQAVAMLATLADKDYRDVPLDVLEDHFSHVAGYNTLDPDIIGLRISNEMLTPFRSILATEPTLTAFKDNPCGLAQWVAENIAIDNSWNPQRLCMSPVGVFRSRLADTHSRDIFFVAVARTLGIKARIDEVTGKVQYFEGDTPCDIVFESTTSHTTSQGILRAQYEPSVFNENPKYYSHFSISKMEDGSPQLLNYPEEGITWASLLRDGERLDEGSYLVVTGTRMADGSVLANLEFVPVCYGGVTDMPLYMRHDDNGVQVIGNFNSENLYNDAESGIKSILSTTGRGYYVLGLIAPNEEPTNHTLRDIALLKEDFEQWGQKMILLFHDADEMARFNNKAEFQNLPSTVVWGTDIDGRIFSEVKQQLNLKSDNRPVFIIADTFNRVIFCSQGYTIGIGEQIKGIIKRISAPAASPASSQVPSPVPSSMAMSSVTSSGNATLTQGLYIGVPLFATGVLARGIKENVRSWRNDHMPNFHTEIDNWIQYSPAAVMLALKSCGVKSRTPWMQMLTADAISMGFVFVVSHSIKHYAHELRPDGSRHNSFPSGHTSTAFMCATMLTKEYGHYSPWVGIGAYTVATATGTMRILNNRHWISDVLAGAGLGIIGTHVGYWLSDKLFNKKKKK